MKGPLDRLTRAAVRRGVRRGVLAGDGKWLAIGALAWLFRFLTKKSDPEVVTETLAPGESIVVTNLGPPPSRRQAKEARRYAASAKARTGADRA